jgi:hypothetical protein
MSTRQQQPDPEGLAAVKTAVLETLVGANHTEGQWEALQAFSAVLQVGAPIHLLKMVIDPLQPEGIDAKDGSAGSGPDFWGRFNEIFGRQEQPQSQAETWLRLACLRLAFEINGNNPTAALEDASRFARFALSGTTQHS